MVVGHHPQHAALEPPIFLLGASLHGEGPKQAGLRGYILSKTDAERPWVVWGVERKTPTPKILEPLHADAGACDSIQTLQTLYNTCVLKRRDHELV